MIYDDDHKKQLLLNNRNNIKNLKQIIDDINSKIVFNNNINRKEHYNELVNIWSYNDKIKLAKLRIKEFLYDASKYYNENNIFNIDDRNVFISFSGGKDSTVLLDLVLKVRNEMNIDILIVPAYAFEITFPETLIFIKNTIKNYQQKYPFLKDLYLAKPTLSWYEILSKKGYPIFSKQISVLLNRVKKVKSQNGLTNWIFGINTSRYKLSKNRLFLVDENMKKFPIDNTINVEYFGTSLYDNSYVYSEKCCDYIKGGLKHLKFRINDKNIYPPSFIGTMSEESFLRKNSWIKYGCNVWKNNRMISRPLSLFKTENIWKYIISNRIEINKMYGFDGKNINNLKFHRLGCTSCPYGSHLESNETDNRFETLYNENIKLYKIHVIANGMYKILIDMGIKIKYDKDYMNLYNLRWKAIEQYYDNFDENFLNLITQIENYNNYKKYDLKKFPKSSWYYSDDLIMKICEKYNIKLSKKQILDKIKKYRNKKHLCN